MSEISSPSPPGSTNPGRVARPAVAPVDIDASCRLPLVVLFLCAALWLVIGSAFTLIASLRFHAPALLADCAALTYGRVRPASFNCILYGFCIPAGLGVALWLLARLGRTKLALPGLVTVGALCWNLGVAAGVAGILGGGSTGFENLEMPGYAGRLLLLGYLMVALWAAVTFHRRREREAYASQWFLLAALFWFPWIYSTANLLLLDFKVRGIAQAVIAWWYSDNLLVVWLGLVGLAAVFYFVPKLASREPTGVRPSPGAAMTTGSGAPEHSGVPFGTETAAPGDGRTPGQPVLHSRYLALLAFWMLILFGSWGGMPASAPVPAWMPASSAVATGVGLITLIAVGLNVHRTLEGKCSRLMAHSALRFIGFGVGAFIVAGLMSAAGALSEVSHVTEFTWYTVARGLLNYYGFFAMVMFGAVYYIVPQLVGMPFPSARLVSAHFWAAAAGVLLFVVPLAVGGIVQGLKLQQPNIPFIEIARGTLPFLRASTTGDLLIALGHLLFLGNLAGLVIRFYRARALSAWAVTTAEMKSAEARP